jgi:putative membrane protein
MRSIVPGANRPKRKKADRRMVALPYCGSAPLPGALLGRFNLDPVLMQALVVLAWAQVAHFAGKRRSVAVSGWLVVAAALMSPLCALSVALFSARVGQHMILILVAAPLIALSLPAGAARSGRLRLWSAAIAFLLALWLWHLPVPYEITFESTLAYWAMHLSLFGSALWLWREVLHADRRQLIDVLSVGVFTSMQMGLLGAVLAMAGHPLFFRHLTTTQAWGFSPLQDQQLGGVLMWVPGIALFLWAALRSLGQLRGSLEEEIRDA